MKKFAKFAKNVGVREKVFKKKYLRLESQIFFLTYP